MGDLLPVVAFPLILRIRRVVSAGLLPVLVAVATSACSPSAFLARRMVEAPNRVPAFVKPAGRMVLQWPAGMLDRFPSGTQQVCCPSASLRWVMVEPADYRLQTTSEQWTRKGHQMGRVTMKFRLPAAEPSTNREGWLSPRPVKGTVFLLHGYGMDLEVMFPWALYLAEAGWRGVLVDLRGHGSSGGRQVFFGAVETNDLRQVRVALEAEGRIAGPYAVLGHSLGAAIALRWQATDPAIRASVAVGPPAELAPAAGRLRDEYARWIPRGWVRRAVERVPEILELPAEALDTLPALALGEVRALVIAGAGDLVTPPEDSQRIRDRLAAGSEFVIVGPVSHEVLPYQFDSYGQRVARWLDRVAGGIAGTTD